MNGDKRFTIGPEDSGKRLDVVVADRLPSLSRSLVQKLLEHGDVLINGKLSKPSRRVASGDLIDVKVTLPASLTAEPEHIPLNILYRDEDVVVLDKPAGMVVHPAAGHAGGTLANALSALFPEARNVGETGRPGIVHRLDKDTSGLMVVALTPAAQLSLHEQIASRRVQRVYLALATGRLGPPEAVIRAPIGRDPKNRKRMGLGGVAARPAETSYRVLEYFTGFTLLEAKLHTGRTHQIRVHLLGMGHPIAGDSAYGGGQVPGLRRQFLHAYRLSFRSPSTDRELNFASPLPVDLQQVLDDLLAGSR